MATSKVSPATVEASFVSGFATLLDLLDLVAKLRDTDEPISSPEGLRQTIDVLLKLGETLGVDPELLAKLRTLTHNPRLFEVVLAVARYVLGLLEHSSLASLSPQNVDLEPQAIDPGTWLAIILEMISLLKRLRQRS